MVLWRGMSENPFPHSSHLWMLILEIFDILFDSFLCVFSLSFQCCTWGQAIAPLPLHIAPIGPGACSAPVPTLKIEFHILWKRLKDITPCYPAWCTGGIECHCRWKEKRTAVRCGFDTRSHNFACILVICGIKHIRFKFKCSLQCTAFLGSFHF